MAGQKAQAGLGAIATATSSTGAGRARVYGYAGPCEQSSGRSGRSFKRPNDRDFYLLEAHDLQRFGSGRVGGAPPYFRTIQVCLRGPAARPVLTLEAAKGFRRLKAHNSLSALRAALTAHKVTRDPVTARQQRTTLTEASPPSSDGTL